MTGPSTANGPRRTEAEPTAVTTSRSPASDFTLDLSRATISRSTAAEPDNLRTASTPPATPQLSDNPGSETGTENRPGFWRRCRDQAESLWNRTVEAAKPVTDFIAGAVEKGKEALSATAEFLRPAIDKVKEILEKPIEAIKGAARACVEFCKHPLESIREAVSQAFEAARELAEKITGSASERTGPREQPLFADSRTAGFQIVTIDELRQNHELFSVSDQHHAPEPEELAVGLSKSTLERISEIMLELGEALQEREARENEEEKVELMQEDETRLKEIVETLYEFAEEHPEAAAYIRTLIGQTEGVDPIWRDRFYQFELDGLIAALDSRRVA